MESLDSLKQIIDSAKRIWLSSRQPRWGQHREPDWVRFGFGVTGKEVSLDWRMKPGLYQFLAGAERILRGSGVQAAGHRDSGRCSDLKR